MTVTNIMLDIETMSTHETNALVLSFAAVRFRLDPAGPVFDGDPVVCVLDPREQLALGREVDPKTAKWWMEQPVEARAAWLRGETTPLRNALQELRGKIFSDTLVWANGIMFDLGNIESLFVQIGIERPWEYNSPRDARTVYACLPKLREMNTLFEEETAHDPLVDCHKQVWKLWERWPFPAGGFK